MRPKRYYRHMSPLAARAIRELYFVGKLKQREIGRLFGIKQNTVSRIISGLVWQELPEVRRGVPGRTAPLAGRSQVLGVRYVPRNAGVHGEIQKCV